MFLNMRKFSDFTPQQKVDILRQLLEDTLHVGIDGPIEETFSHKLSVEGVEELYEKIEQYVDQRVTEKVQKILLEAKTKAVSGDISWFDKNIDNNINEKV